MAFSISLFYFGHGYPPYSCQILFVLHPEAQRIKHQNSCHQKIPHFKIMLQAEQKLCSWHKGGMQQRYRWLVMDCCCAGYSIVVQATCISGILIHILLFEINSKCAFGKIFGWQYDSPFACANKHNEQRYSTRNHTVEQNPSCLQHISD